MRDATGRDAPLEPLAPIRPAPLAARTVVAFWSLVGGVGCSTTAALVAHRAAAAGVAPVLVDLDRWAPSLALRAERTAATVTDALLRPGGETALLSRWANVPFLPGSTDLHRTFDGPRVVELLRALRRDRAVVIDLGSGADALDPTVLEAIDRLCVVVGSRVAQLQSAFCAAGRLPWPLIAAVPHDPYLAKDEFASRAPTLRAIDKLIRALG